MHFHLRLLSLETKDCLREVLWYLPVAAYVETAIHQSFRFLSIASVVRSVGWFPVPFTTICNKYAVAVYKKQSSH